MIFDLSLQEEQLYRSTIDGNMKLNVRNILKKHRKGMQVKSLKTRNHGRRSDGFEQESFKKIEASCVVFTVRSKCINLS